MSGSVINTIPASTIVDVVPSVITAGGSALATTGLLLNTNTLTPIGTILSFPNLTAVGNYYGATTHTYQEASVYFNGFDNSNKKPAALLVSQYPTANVGAWLHSGPVTLAGVKTITSGTFSVTIDGTVQTTGAINLGSATSLSQAGQILDLALDINGPVQAVATFSIGATFTGTATGASLAATSVTGLISVGDTITGTGMTAGTTIVAQVSGTTGGAGTYTLSHTSTASAASLTADSNVLDVTHMTSGTIAVGQQVGNPGSYVTALLTGTGGVGTYTVSGAASQVGSAPANFNAPVISYTTLNGGYFAVISSTTGAASTITYATGTDAAKLGLTQATGAVLSQGATANPDPATYMNAITAQTEDWATFWTEFDPDNGSGNTQKLAFAAWTNTQQDGYAYIAWDSDLSPTTSPAATNSLGYILAQNGSNGTIVVSEPSEITYNVAAFVAGWAASLDFTETNGRATLAFRSQAGLTPTVTNATAAANLIANGYNYYGAYATRAQEWVFLYPGSVSGAFQWADSYINQIEFNAALQQALVAMLTQNKSIPYNVAGYALIRAALLDPINAATNFGTIRQGIPLSAAQAADVNNAAGVQIDGVLSTQGWYLQILPATAQVRAARQSPPMTLWYTDGQSVQQITLASVLVQ